MSPSSFVLLTQTVLAPAHAHICAPTQTRLHFRARTTIHHSWKVRSPASTSPTYFPMAHFRTPPWVAYDHRLAAMGKYQACACRRFDKYRLHNLGCLQRNTVGGTKSRMQDGGNSFGCLLTRILCSCSTGRLYLVPVVSSD
jgi:hypothetical protein